MTRLYTIDNLRGIAFIFMIYQHLYYFYDVSKNYNTNLAKNIFVDYSGQIARTLFILLAGYSVYISYKNNKKNHIKKRFKRSLEVLLHGMIITLVTYVLYPQYFIRFGILHFLSLGTFIISFIAPYKKLTIIFLILSIIFKIPQTNNVILDTISGANLNYNMMDWFPFNKWIQILLLGLIIGQNVDNLKINFLENNNLLTSIGKNSLNLYTLHIIILLIYYKLYNFMKK